MKRIFLLLVLVLFLSCKSDKVFTEKIIHKEYELYKVEDSKATLVLFPCFPCDLENTKNEFSIIEKANNNKINVLLLNYNQKLYLKEEELVELTNFYNSIFKDNGLSNENIIIGGFSGGGNVSLILGNNLIKTNHDFSPNGIFIVDAPIDILGLYRVAEKNIKANYSEESVAESNRIIETLKNDLGNPTNSIKFYEKYSIFTNESNHSSNLDYLKNVNLRFYIETDYNWWKVNRNNDPEDLNASFIERFHEELKKKDFHKIELIKTHDKGYRADGTRHPHSWSIVDKDKLINWVLNED